MKIVCAGMDSIVFAHPWFMGEPWYDWAYVEYVERNSRDTDIEKYYPLRLFGFV